MRDSSQIALWARYIDDILLLWTGSYEDLISFIATLNLNERGIELKHEASQTSVHYLDLNIGIKEGSFVTSTFFKDTDRNAFIPTDSCHHAPWIKGVPKSQYLRLKRNCTDPHDFLFKPEYLLTAS